MIVKAKLEKVQRLKTKINLVFSISTRDADTPFQDLLGFAGNLFFIGKKITNEIIEAVNNRRFAIDLSGKTPSQELRAKILELYYKNNPEGDDAVQFYTDQMRKIIQHYEKKL